MPYDNLFKSQWGSGWGIHVYPWLIHVNVWQKPLQYCKVTSLQLIKKNKKLRSQFPEIYCLSNLFYFIIIFFFSSTSLLLLIHFPPPSHSHIQWYNPMDCSLPGSSVHGLFQARTLEGTAISFSCLSNLEQCLCERNPVKFSGMKLVVYVQTNMSIL